MGGAEKASSRNLPLSRNDEHRRAADPPLRKRQLRRHLPRSLGRARRGQRGSRAPGYGEDAWTRRPPISFATCSRDAAKSFFVFNGTAANSLALASMCQSYHSILCHETAHVEADECGAPEFFQRHKGAAHAGAGRQDRSAGVDRMVNKRTDIHYPKPRAISLRAGDGVRHGIRQTDQAIWAKAVLDCLKILWTARALRARGRLARLRAKGSDVAGWDRCAVLRRDEERHPTSAKAVVFSTGNSRGSSTIAASTGATCGCAVTLEITGTRGAWRETFRARRAASAARWP